MKSKIRVLIVDDHGVVRAGLTAILAFEDDIEVVGEAANGIQALRQCEALKPDVVIMDLMMPHMNGTEAIAKIASEHLDTKTICLTTYGSADDIGRALKTGAVGALIKTASNEELVTAIRKVAGGERYIAPEIKRMLMSEPPTPDLTV